MRRISWYLKRVRVMKPREIVYRIRQLLTLLSMHIECTFGIGGARSSLSAGPEAFRFCTETKSLLPPVLFDMSALSRAKPALFRSEVRVAGKTWKWTDATSIWHRAPDTGRTWPCGFFATIRFREGNPFGDIRHLWEPSRLQHLVDLAMLARTSGAQERSLAVQVINEQFSSWIKCNPPLRGPHYISAMECALRLIAACHALDILRDHLGDSPSWDALVWLVGTHAPFIERRISMHSSSGNHTITEAAGMIYAGLLFPEMHGSKRRLDKGIAILANSLRVQVLPDGGGAEQALWYHYFNMQLVWLVNELLKYHDRSVKAEISKALDRGMHFLSTMGCSSCWIPPVGDGDSGYALSRYLKLPAFASNMPQQTQIFPDSGYTTVQVGSDPRVKLIFDHGPLGMPPSYGHGHADALSLLLRVNNRDVFVDPGTYTYTGDQDWRRYFRGTAAHNTVTVGNEDQAQQSGCFLWSKPYRSQLTASDINGSVSGRILAEHDGYRRIGVRHLRGIAWSHDEWLVIRDYLSGDGVCTLDLHWHLGAEPYWQNSHHVLLRLPEGELAMGFEGGDMSLHCGSRAPKIGWRSRFYGEVEPITTVRIHRQGPLPHKFTTLLSLHGGLPPQSALEDALQWLDHRML